MASVTVTFVDVHKDGDSQVGCSIKVEHAKSEDPEGPATNAMITALSVQRLFQHRVLMTLVPLVCTDALQQRQALMQMIAQAAAGAPPAADGLPPGPSEAIPGTGTAAGGSPPPLSAV